LEHEGKNKAMLFDEVDLKGASRTILRFRTKEFAKVIATT